MVRSLKDAVAEGHEAAPPARNALRQTQLAQREAAKGGWAHPAAGGLHGVAFCWYCNGDDAFQVSKVGKHDNDKSRKRRYLAWIPPNEKTESLTLTAYTCRTIEAHWTPGAP